MDGPEWPGIVNAVRQIDSLTGNSDFEQEVAARAFELWNNTGLDTGICVTTARQELNEENAQNSKSQGG